MKSSEHPIKIKEVFLMKKMLSILLASALVLGLLVTGTLAAGHFGHGTGICQNSEACYPDAD